MFILGMIDEEYYYLREKEREKEIEHQKQQAQNIEGD